MKSKKYILLILGLSLLIFTPVVSAQSLSNIVVVIRNYLDTPTSTTNLNGDTVVNTLDIAQAIKNIAAPTITTTPVPNDPAPLGISGTWRLVFRDEFDTSLNRNIWVTCFPDADTAGCTNDGNPEIQWHLDRNVTVENGLARMIGKRERVTGSDGKTYDFTTGMLSSGPQPSVGRNTAGFSYQYGIIESRMKIAGGAGSWPTFISIPPSGQQQRSYFT